MPQDRMYLFKNVYYTPTQTNCEINYNMKYIDKINIIFVIINIRRQVFQ